MAEIFERVLSFAGAYITLVVNKATVDLESQTSVFSSITKMD